MSKEKTALYLCGAHRGGKVIKQLQTLIDAGVPKITVEESGIKQQRDKLVAVCEAQHEAIDKLFAMLILKDENFRPSKSGQPWRAINQGNAILAEVKEADKETIEEDLDREKFEEEQQQRADEEAFDR